MKLICIGGVLFCLIAAGLTGQSASRIDDILAQEVLRYGSGAYLLLGSTGQVDRSATPSDSVEVLKELGFHLDGKEVGDSLNLGELSLLVMRVFDVRGGLLYSLLEDPRYAARELEFRQVIQGRAFPGMRVNGQRGLRIVNRAAALHAEGDL